MQPEDYDRLKADIQSNGYDMKQPIYTYNGGILDGWNRYKVCMEVGVVPVYKEYSGTDIDARSSCNQGATLPVHNGLPWPLKRMRLSIKPKPREGRSRPKHRSVTKSNEGLYNNLLLDSHTDPNTNAAATKLATTTPTGHT